MKRKIYVGIISALLFVSVVYAAVGAGTLSGRLFDEKSDTDNTILCPKDPSTWECIKYTIEDRYVPAGLAKVYFSVSGETLEVRPYIRYGLDPKSTYQLMLRGPGKTDADDALASMSGDLQIAGCWDGVTSYAGPCKKKDKGYYNFEMNAQYPIYQTYNLDLPEGIYKSIRFIVRLQGDVDGYGGPLKNTVVMRGKDKLNFVVAKPYLGVVVP